MAGKERHGSLAALQASNGGILLWFEPLFELKDRRAESMHGGEE